MNASPEQQLRLLEVQRLDTEIDRGQLRRRTLAELAEISAGHDELAATGRDLVLLEAEDSDLARAQTSVEREVDLVRTRAVRDRQRLDTGQVASPKELTGLQSELASLARRQGDLEDQVLEVMEQREALATRLDGLRSRREELGAAVAAAEERRDAAFAEIDAAAAGLGGERAQVAADLPGPLLALYDRVRGERAGVGAAALERGRCTGCNLTLAGDDLQAIRTAGPDAVVRCENCRRILVRTPESGL